MLNAKLVVVGGGNAKVTEIQLKLPVTIGRSREAKLKLPHPLISRKHCEVFEREGQLFVRDLGSLNGTYVNSQRIESEHVLQPNQLLTLGTVTFRAIYDATEINGNGQAHELHAADTDSERPTDRADAPPNLRPAAQPAAHTADEAESETHGNDTEGNFLDLDQIELIHAGNRPPQEVEMASSIFSELGQPVDNGSVSLSAIGNLPGSPEALSFLGGVRVDDHRAKDSASVPTGLPKIDTGHPNAADKKSSKRRPR